MRSTYLLASKRLPRSGDERVSGTVHGSLFNNGTAHLHFDHHLGNVEGELMGLERGRSWRAGKGDRNLEGEEQGKVAVALT